MGVVVVGAGAIGMLTACLLVEAGDQATLLVRKPGQASKINEEGILKDGIRHDIKAITDWNQIPAGDLIMLAVKYDGIPEALEQLSRLKQENPVVFMQNGMMHLELARNLPQSSVAVCSVEHGSLKVGDTSIQHTGKGIFKCAVLKGEKSAFGSLNNEHGLVCEWHPDADALLLRKVLLNSLINPLTALLDLKNGELLTNGHALKLLKELYSEMVRAFPEMEDFLSFKTVADLCLLTAENQSSMLSDKKAGRKMELDTIVLYTLKRASADMPVLRTLYHSLKAIEVSI
ncbi:MAG TPA: 2-dehydropantoate 2-reductase [Planococcus sp. (in: firmicutes)]|nr:2-dehydropantoate 2-reductase [Planococcus sp. (in: firmicutes)]